MPSVLSINVISPIHRCGVKFLLINFKFPMTSKLHMLHGVNNPYMVICNQSIGVSHFNGNVNKKSRVAFKEKAFINSSASARKSKQS